MAGTNINQIGVEAIVRGIPYYESQLRRLNRLTVSNVATMSASLRSLNVNVFSGAGNAINNFGRQLSGLGGQIASLGFAMTFGFTVPVVAGFAATVSAGREFETKMIKIQNLAGTSAETMKFWNRELLRMGTALAMSPNELADALYYISSVGIRDQALQFQFLEKSAKAAAVGLGDVGQIAKVAVAVFENFPELSVDKIFDTIFAAVREGGAEVEEFASQLGRLLPVAKQVGVSFDAVAGAVAQFTRSGVSSSVAVTSFLNVLAFFADASEKAKTTLLEFNTSYAEIQQMAKDKDLIYTLDYLYRLMGTDISKLFTQRATYGAFNVANAEQMAQIIHELEYSMGDLDNAFRDYAATTDFAFKSFAATLKATSILLYNSFKAPLAAIMAQLTEFLVKLNEIIYNNPELVTMATKFALIAAALGPLVIILGQVIRGFGTLAIVAAIPLRVFGSLLSAIFLIPRAISGIIGGVLSLGGAFAGLSVKTAMAAISTSKLLVPFLFAGRLFAKMGLSVLYLSRSITIVLPLLKSLFSLLGGILPVIVTRLGTGLVGLASRISFAAFSLTGSFSKAWIALYGILTRVIGGIGIKFVLLGAQMQRTALSVMIPALGMIGSALSAIAGAFGTVGASIAGFLGSLLTLASPIGIVIAAFGGLLLAVGGVKSAIRSIGNKMNSQFGNDMRSLGQNMKAHGQNIIHQFANGMIAGFTAVVQALTAMAAIITEWLKPGSPPKLLPDLVRWGSGALSAYLEGWSQFDFSAFKAISDKFRAFFSSLIPATDEGEGRQAMIANLLQFRNVLADIFREINLTGTISTSGWQSLQRALEGATEEMRQYVLYTIQAAQAQERVEAAQRRVNQIQDQINAVQRRYAAALDPIRDRMEEISQAREDYTDERRIKELNRIINDSRAPADVVKFAKLELEEIGLRQQERLLEAQQERELDPLEQLLLTAQDQLAYYEQEYQYLQDQAEFYAQLVDLQTENNELLKDFFSAIRDAVGGAEGIDKPEKPETGEPFVMPEITQVERLPVMAGPMLGPYADQRRARLLPWAYGESPAAAGRDRWAQLLGIDLTAPTGGLDKQLDDLKTAIGDLGKQVGELASVGGSRLGELYENKIKPFIGAVVEFFNLPVFNVVGNKIFETFDRIKKALTGIGTQGNINILQGLGNFLKFIFGFFSTVAAGAVNAGLEFIASLVEAVAGLINVFANANSGTALDFFKNLAFALFEFVKIPFKALGEGFRAIWESLGTEVQTGLRNLWEGILIFIAQKVFNVLMWFQTLWDRVKNGFQKVYDFLIGNSLIPDLVNGIIDWIINLKDRAIAFFVELWENAKAKFTEGKDNVIGAVKEFRDTVVTKFNEIKTHIATRIDAVKIKLQQFVDKIKLSVITWIETLKQKVQEKFEEVRKTIVEKIDAAKTKLQEIITRIIEVKTEVEGRIQDIIGFFQNLATEVTTAIQTVIGWIDDILTRLTTLWNWLQTHVFHVQVEQDQIDVPDTPPDNSPNPPGQPNPPNPNPPCNPSSPYWPECREEPAGTTRSGGKSYYKDYSSILKDNPLIIANALRMQNATLQAAGNVVIGPNYITNDMSMSVFEARVKRVIERATR